MQWCGDGIRALIDTESISTLVIREVLRRLAEKLDINVCKCSVIIFSGHCKVLGENERKIEDLSGIKTCVHVLEDLTEQYNVLVGCDVLNKVGFEIRGRQGKWEMILGMKIYHGRLKRRVGEHRVEVVQMEQVTLDCLLSEFSDIFYREDCQLPATGKTTHEIVLKENKVS